MDKKEQLDRFLDKFLNDENINFDELEVDESFAELFEISVLLKKGGHTLDDKVKEDVFKTVHAGFNNDQNSHGGRVFSVILQILAVMFDVSSPHVANYSMSEPIRSYNKDFPKNCSSSSLNFNQFLYNYTINGFMVPLGLKTLC